MQWLGENGIPFSIIFTKADKLKPNAILRHIEDYKKVLLETWEDMPNYFITSSSNEAGKDEVLSYIESLNDNLQLN
jgi:GTP-binding protein